MRVWLDFQNEGLLRQTRRYSNKISYSEYDHFPGLLVADVSDKNELSARAGNPNVVLGAVRPWDEVRDSRCLYVLVDESPLTIGPLFMSLYSAIDVRLHKHKKLISQKRDAERTELLPGTNLVNRAFDTFAYFFNQRCKTGFSPQLVLYDPDGQLDETGNMANPSTVAEIPGLLAQMRSRKSASLSL